MSYKNRVVKELNDLSEKTEKLMTFFQTDTFEELSYEERVVLEFQYFHMTEYKACLNTRIVDWKEK